MSPKLTLAMSLVVVGLLVLGAALWVLGGGLRDLRDGSDWVAALGTDDGMQRIAIIIVGVATALAGVFFIIMMAFQRGAAKETAPIMVGIAGAVLLMADGAMLVSIGWIAVPFIAEGGLDIEHPFVKSIELLMIFRATLSSLGGGLIGVSVAASAWETLRDKSLPGGLVAAGIGAGALAIVGGALVITGIGATLQTLGIIGSVAWSGSRSGIAARIAMKQNGQETPESSRDRDR